MTLAFDPFQFLDHGSDAAKSLILVRSEVVMADDITCLPTTPMRGAIALTTNERHRWNASPPRVSSVLPVRLASPKATRDELACFQPCPSLCIPPADAV